MTILPCKPDSVVSSTAEMKDLSVTTLRTVEVSEIKQLINTQKKMIYYKMNNYVSNYNQQ